MGQGAMGRTMKWGRARGKGPWAGQYKRGRARGKGPRAGPWGWGQGPDHEKGPGQGPGMWQDAGCTSRRTMALACKVKKL